MTQTVSSSFKRHLHLILLKQRRSGMGSHANQEKNKNRRGVKLSSSQNTRCMLPSQGRCTTDKPPSLQWTARGHPAQDPARSPAVEPGGTSGGDGRRPNQNTRPRHGGGGRNARGRARPSTRAAEATRHPAGPRPLTGTQAVTGAAAATHPGRRWRPSQLRRPEPKQTTARRAPPSAAPRPVPSGNDPIPGWGFLPLAHLGQRDRAWLWEGGREGRRLLGAGRGLATWGRTVPIWSVHCHGCERSMAVSFSALDLRVEYLMACLLADRHPFPAERARTLRACSLWSRFLGNWLL